MKVFVTSYHISVNHCLVDDLLAIGLEVIMPSEELAGGRISFFAPNIEHQNKAGVSILPTYSLLTAISEPIAILIPCMQLYDDMMRIYEDRGKRDVIVFLTANSDIKTTYPLDGSDYVMTHDIDFHRLTKAKYKVMYFSRPLILRNKKTEAELRKSFDEKKLKLYINNFSKEGFESEYEKALELRDKYYKATGWTIPFYGYDMPDGWLLQNEVQDQMVDSMFTIVFKRRETWGQMVNESMLLGTPCVFLKEFIYSTFKYYEINEETAIIENNVDDIVNKITSMTYEQYETLVNESYSQSNMFCNDIVRREKLSWLFNKIASSDKMTV